jgi:AraC-like DNA-binding protein
MSGRGSDWGAVARTLGYFCKLLRRETGLRLTDYLTRRRVEKAKELLLDPHARIGEDVDAAGFQSLSQFNRAFKRVRGEQPTTWREHTGLH